jgi:hypothetical protein
MSWGAALVLSVKLNAEKVTESNPLGPVLIKRVASMVLGV